MTNNKKIYGWGRAADQISSVHCPQSKEEIKSLLKQSDLTLRGNGRSYGDSSLGPVVLETLSLNKILDFDKRTGIVTSEAGVLISELNRFSIPKGWFIPVSPGTSLVTIGGAVAGDVHGKNHHLVGAFSQFICSMEVILGDGKSIEVSKNINSDLFHATCGGMGLTGVITKVSFQLIKIESSFMDVQTIKTHTLSETINVFNSNKNSAYSVAWIDCISKGESAGKGIVSIGKHSRDGGLIYKKKSKIRVPFNAPNFLLNKPTMQLFNKLNYLLSSNKVSKIDINKYFYPLDRLIDWNKMYGSKGFLQYQFVIPKENGEKNLKKILFTISKSKEKPFLAVLKIFGPCNSNLISFPMEGFTLALDFPFTNTLTPLLQNLDALVMSFGGRINLTKDSVLSEENFKVMYPNWTKFQEIRHKYNSLNKFTSLQSKRIGLK